MKAGLIHSWEYEKLYELWAEGRLIGTHKPDFTVYLPGGRVEVHEVKGGRATMTEAWAIRKKLFQANYPNIKYKVFGTGVKFLHRKE